MRKLTRRRALAYAAGSVVAAVAAETPIAALAASKTQEKPMLLTEPNTSAPTQEGVLVTRTRGGYRLDAAETVDQVAIEKPVFTGPLGPTLSAALDLPQAPDGAPARWVQSLDDHRAALYDVLSDDLAPRVRKGERAWVDLDRSWEDGDVVLVNVIGEGYELRVFESRFYLDMPGVREKRSVGRDGFVVGRVRQVQRAVAAPPSPSIELVKTWRESPEWPANAHKMMPYVPGILREQGVDDATMGEFLDDLNAELDAVGYTRPELPFLQPPGSSPHTYGFVVHHSVTKRLREHDICVCDPMQPPQRGDVAAGYKNGRLRVGTPSQLRGWTIVGKAVAKVERIDDDYRFEEA